MSGTAQLGAASDVLARHATALGSYTIQAIYNGTADFLGSTDTSHSLTVSQASTSTAAASSSVTSSPAGQNVPLSATVTSAAGTVDEGTETFTILSGATVIGLAVTVNVENGTASASDVLLGATAPGTYTIQAVYNGTADFLGSTDTSHTLTVSQAKPFQLSIQIEPPSNATAGQVLSPSIVVDEEDRYGNIETSDNSTVITATLGSGSGPLKGTFTETVVGGVATFADLYDDTAETVTLTFSTGNLVTATSTAIIVGPAGASKLFAIQQPASLTAGENFAAVVEEEDQFGNMITGDSTSIVTVARGPVGTANLQGADLTVTLVHGVATFSGLFYKKAETIDISFSTNASGVSGVTSGNIVVSPAPATQLVAETEPSSTATAGVAFQTQPVIYEEDQYSNLETGDDSTVVSAMQNSGRGPLEGTLNATVSGGVARFSNVADTNAETTTLSFVSGTLFSLPTTPTVVSAAPAAQLVVTTAPPSSIVAGLAFTVVISAEDQFHNVASTFTGNLTIALATNSAASTLGGTTTVAVIDGVATFSNLTVDHAGSSYAFNVSGNGPPSITSTPFNVISPTISGEQVVKLPKKNKRGKAVGAPVLMGFTLDYGTSINPLAAGLTVDYQVTATTTKRVKKRIVTGSQPVAVTASFNASSNSVTLSFHGKPPKFANGGQIKVIYTPSSGAGGPPLPSDTEFVILRKAKGIKAG